MSKAIESSAFAKGSSLKDSFYKQRLVKAGTSNHFVRTLLQTHHEADDEDQPSCIEEQQLDFTKILSKLMKTADGSGYAYLHWNSTYKRLPTLQLLDSAYQCIAKYPHLQQVDISFNCLKSMRSLSGLKYLTVLKATNNQLTQLLDIKDSFLHLDTLDAANNLIEHIPNLSKHVYLRILILRGNKISQIEGLNGNKQLRVLDLAENQLEQISGLNDLRLTHLNLSNNRLEIIKGLTKLDQLRVLDLSLNRICKLAGLVHLISLRELHLAKNTIKHTRELAYLENLAYLTVLDLCFNPVQQRKYYRLQVIYKLPMLHRLDGSEVNKGQICLSESLYGLDLDEKKEIFKRILPEEQFVDRRLHKVQLIQNQTDSEGEGTTFIDQYDEEGKIKFSSSNRSRWSKDAKKSDRAFSGGRKTGSVVGANNTGGITIAHK